MTLRPSITLLALTLAAASGTVRGTETARPNDMDGDGSSDVIWRNTGTAALVYWSAANSQASHTLALRFPSDWIFDPRQLTPVFAMSDVWDSANKTMLVMTSQATGELGLYPSSEPDLYFGGGSFPGSTFPPPVGHGDFDGDGTADLFYRDSDGSNYIVDSAVWADWGATYQAVPTVAISWQVAGIGDFDGDGRSDVLWRNQASGANVIWRSANYLTQMGVRGVTNPAWKIVAVADFDGDGRDDIFWRNATSGANVIWRSGNALAQQAVRSVTNLAWQVATTGDFDGDGKVDVMWRNRTTGSNVVWKSANAATQMALRAVNLAWTVVR